MIKQSHLRKEFIIIIVLIVIASFYQLTGCGGSGTGSSSSSQVKNGTDPGSAKYYINITLKFPDKKQPESQKLIEREANSIIEGSESLATRQSTDLGYFEVMLKKACTDEQIGETRRVDRPRKGNQVTVTFFDVPEGSIRLIVKGYSTGKVIVCEGESKIDMSLASVTGGGASGSGILTGGSSGNNALNNEPVVLPTGTVVDGPSAPKIISVEPKTIGIGDTVTIRGRGFGKRDKYKDEKESCIYFGGVKAAEYVYWSDTYIVCKVPKNATLSNLNVCVSVGGGAGGALISAGNSPSTVVSVVSSPSGGGGGGGSSGSGSAIVDSTTLVEVPAITAGNYTTVNLRLGGSAGAYATGTQIQQMSSFYVGKYEVTNTDYCAFLNASDAAGSNNPEEGVVTWWDSAGDETYNGILYTAGNTVGSRYTVRSGFENRPVVYVSWYGAVAYCNWLTLKKGMVVGDQCYGGFTADGITRWGVDGANYHPERKGYRLPTEAEWEYISRFNTATTLSTMDYFWGEQYVAGVTPENIANYCWYTANSDGNHHDVGGKTANGLGLYDIYGNVWEWCSDVWNDTFFPLDDFAGGNPVINPKGTKTDNGMRVTRSSCWFQADDTCNSYYREYDSQDNRFNYYGFRIVRTK